MADDIHFYNRNTGEMETEKVYGEAFLRWAYGNPLGSLALHSFVKRPFFSRWYGRRMDAPKTREKIAPFLVDYEMSADDFVKSPHDFAHFNDFFYRELKPEARPIAGDDSVVTFPADGRHLGFQKASDISGVFVKGQKFDLARLLGDGELARKYADGALVLSRLCPVDYHRFHFPCAGTPSPTRLINGPLFSVSPIALRKQLAYLWENKRTITELETESMGTVLCMEIGATCVGSINQTFRPNEAVAKGDEKGYFAFGGSSTITIFEPEAIELESDLIEHSAKMVELYSLMGSPMARVCHSARL